MKISFYEFNQQMDRLRKHFGPWTYPDAERKIIFGKLNDLTLEWLESTVSNILLRNVKGVDWVEIIGIERRRIREGEEAADREYFHKLWEGKEVPAGLEKALAEIGATSFQDAIESGKWRNFKKQYKFPIEDDYTVISPDEQQS